MDIFIYFISTINYIFNI